MACPTARHPVSLRKHVLNSKVHVECCMEISEELLEVGSTTDVSAGRGGIVESDSGGEQFVYRSNVAPAHDLFNMAARNGFGLFCWHGFPTSLNYFTRIQYSLRVKKRLYVPHPLQRSAVFRLHELPLYQAHPVFARGGASQFQGAFHQ